LTFSGHTNVVRESKQRSSRNGARIDHVILHHSASTDANGVVGMMVSGSRTVSSNYVIGKDGTVYGVVPEDFRAWTSGASSDGGKGAAYDRRSITFEVADEIAGDAHGWPISEASYAALARVVADVSRRYGIPLDRDHIVGHRELWTRFRASYATACPGGMDMDRVVCDARQLLGQAVGTIAGSGNRDVIGRNYTSRPTADVQRLVGANPDGAYGTDTTAKVVAWQKAHGLAADGDWGTASDAKGFAAHASAAPAFPLPAGSYFGPKSGPAQSVSGYFSHRDDLARWQRQMVARGWTFRSGADGLYGDETRENAKAFQKEKGLEVDGLIGAATWAATWTSPIT
jgi:peptidoglycan hydrolase-like protein with peptidoglycan-binding domain